MKVLLHIGTEKTGTKSIQEFLSQSSSKLATLGIAPAVRLDESLGKNSSCLVMASEPEPGSSLLRHRELSFDAYRQEIRQRIFECLDKARRWDVSTVVFSSEHLSSRLVSDNSLIALKKLFPADVEAKVCCYLRRQDELLLGAQAEGIKYGNPDLEIELAALADEDKPYAKPFFDFERMLGPWQRVFGRSNIIVAPFEKSQLAGGDVVVDFCTRMLRIKKLDGLIQTSGSSGLKLNKRLSAEALFVLAKLNCLGDACPEQNRKFIMEIDDFSESVLIEPNRLADFYWKFDRSNRAVAREYLGQDQLFLSETTSRQFFDFRKPQVQVDTLLKYLNACSGRIRPPNQS